MTTGKNVISKAIFVAIVLTNTILLLPINQADALTYKPGDGIFVSGVDSGNTPKWRSFSGLSNSFSLSTDTAVGTAKPRQFVVRTSPKKTEAIAGYIDDSSKLQIMCYDGMQWSNEWSTPVTYWSSKQFDIAYSTASGDAVVMYTRNTSPTNELGSRKKLVELVVDRQIGLLNQ